MKTTVYRIETKDGTGMYGSGGCREAGFGYDNSRHPSPEDDALLSKLLEEKSGNAAWCFSFSPYHFGFATIEQLRNWIYRDEWLLELHNSGHVLAIIESEEVFAGYTQAIFIRPETYQTLDIKEYFNL